MAMNNPPFSQPGTYETTIATSARGELFYTLSLPAEFDPSGGPYALVVALHYGFDRTAPFPPYYGRGVLEGLVEPALKDLSPIIIAPDSHGEGWTEPAIGAAVLELCDAIIEDYPVDRNRTLLTGFSLGGLGTWHLCSKAENRFKTAISVAAAPSDSSAAAYPDVPLYVIHSEADEIFPIAKIEHSIDTLRARGTEVAYERLTGTTHYNVPGFTAALSRAIPWLEQHWEKQAT